MPKIRMGEYNDLSLTAQEWLIALFPFFYDCKVVNFQLMRLLGSHNSSLKIIKFHEEIKVIKIQYQCI